MPKTKPTNARILDAAELLFELNGFEATSTRQIAQAAEANSAAPNFHFSSKENLIKEVFRRRMEPLVEDRLKRLQRILETSNEPDLGSIYDSFVEPLIELRKSRDKNKQAFLRLLARNTLAPRPEFTELLTTDLAPYVESYTDALTQALPNIAPAVVRIRFDLAMATIARGFSSAGINTHEETRGFVLAGLSRQTD